MANSVNTYEIFNSIQANEITFLTAKLLEAEVDIKRLKGEPIVNIEALREKIKHDLDVHSAARIAVENQLLSKSNELNALSLEHEKIAGENVNLNLQLQKLQKQIAAQQRELTEQQAKIQQQKELSAQQKTQSDQQLQELQKQIAAQQTQLTDQQTKIEELESQLQQQKREEKINQVIHKIETARNRFSENNPKYVKLNGLCEQLKRKTNKYIKKESYENEVATDIKNYINDKDNNDILLSHRGFFQSLIDWLYGKTASFDNQLFFNAGARPTMTTTHLEEATNILRPTGGSTGD